MARRSRLAKTLTKGGSVKKARSLTPQKANTLNELESEQGLMDDIPKNSKPEIIKSFEMIPKDNVKVESATHKMKVYVAVAIAAAIVCVLTQHAFVQNRH